jgi:hypothetical protein
MATVSSWSLSLSWKTLHAINLHNQNLDFGPWDFGPWHLGCDLTDLNSANRLKTRFRAAVRKAPTRPVRFTVRGNGGAKRPGRN